MVQLELLMPRFSADLSAGAGTYTLQFSLVFDRSRLTLLVVQGCTVVATCLDTVLPMYCTHACML